jgi:hypothetical protein
MTQAELEREIARSTGDSVATIRQRGFSLMQAPSPTPLVVDWDELDAQRTAVLPQRSRMKKR